MSPAVLPAAATAAFSPQRATSSAVEAAAASAATLVRRATPSAALAAAAPLARRASSSALVHCVLVDRIPQVHVAKALLPETLEAQWRGYGREALTRDVIDVLLFHAVVVLLGTVKCPFIVRYVY